MTAILSQKIRILMRFHGTIFSILFDRTFTLLEKSQENLILKKTGQFALVLASI